MVMNPKGCAARGCFGCDQMGQGQGGLIQSCSLLLGCDYIILLVFSYLLDVNQRTSINSVYTGGDVDDN